MKVDVGEVERHRAPLGDHLRLVEQLPRLLRLLRQGAGVQGGGEEGLGEVIKAALPQNPVGAGFSLRPDIRSAMRSQAKDLRLQNLGSVR
jgi:hypothetical protein